MNSLAILWVTLGIIICSMLVQYFWKYIVMESNGHLYGHYIVDAAILLLIFAFLVPILRSTLTTPTAPKGWGTMDYEVAKTQRKGLGDFLASKQLDPTKTPMLQFSVATASFGGIFTEAADPWIGSVNPEAVRLQVEGGARAVIFDIWPDPTDSAVPTVCSMIDNNQWFAPNWWRTSGGLSQSVGRYSNWQLMTRNTAPAAEMIQTACGTAFSVGAQSGDPFFLILKLHGAPTLTYLNRLADAVKRGISGHEMSATGYGNMQNQTNFCSTPVSEFMNRVCVIVIPDIQANYNTAASTHSYSSFTKLFKQSQLADYTNVLEQSPNSVFFDIDNAGAAFAQSQLPCGSTSGEQNMMPVEVGFCVIQPSIGGTATDNDTLYAPMAYTECVTKGAQFVGVNMFAPAGDNVMNDFFGEYFGTYSFYEPSATAASQ